MTVTFSYRRMGQVAGCALAALLCILATALFAPVDASATRSEAAGYALVPAEPIVAAATGREMPIAVVADGAVADLDDPFEHGRLPLAVSGVVVAPPAASAPVASADTGPAGAQSPLPERPPRA